MTLVKTDKNVPSSWLYFFDDSKLFGNRYFEGEFEFTLPAVNIKERINEFVIEFAAPGFKKSNFKIEAAENTLTVSAKKEIEAIDKNDLYARQEYSYCSFSRSFTMPQKILADAIEVKYKEGILKLEIQKNK